MVKVNQTPQKTKLLRLNKYFSAPALLDQIRKDFEKIPDPRRSGQQFSLPDVLMSGLAVFGLKYPSLLKFDEQRNEERVRTNLRNLYGVIQAPCDTQLRTVLDEVSPDELRLPFISIHQQLQSQKVASVAWIELVTSVAWMERSWRSAIQGLHCHDLIAETISTPLLLSIERVFIRWSTPNSLYNVMHGKQEAPTESYGSGP